MSGKLGRAVRPIVKPTGSTPVAGGSFQRAASTTRIQANLVKRSAVREIANQMSQMPRPIVRPVARPQKVMPSRPVMNRPVIPRPVVLPVGSQSLQPKPGAGAPRQIPQFRPLAGKILPPGGMTSMGTLNTASMHPQISTEVMALQSALSELQNRSSFSDVQTDLLAIDQDLDHMLKLLEGARSQGFIYQSDLDDTAYQIVDRWQSVRDQAVRIIQQKAPVFQGQLAPLGAQIQRLNAVISNPTAAPSLLSATHTQVNTLLSQVNEVHYQIERSYAEIRSQVQRLNSRLAQIHWALDQLSAATFNLNPGESLVMAVSARWDREGSDDPEGVLYLTNKRLIFEQKEKVATKKVLFLTMASELVQKVLIDQPLSGVLSVKAQNKGLFGHQDFIEVQFSVKELGLVSFHLNGQDSARWAEWIQDAKTGRIEADQTTGSGISLTDLTGPVTLSDILALQKEANDLQDEITLKSIRQELVELENELFSLERKLASLRTRGYRIEKNLEADIQILKVQWERIRANAEASVDAQVKILSEQAGSLQKLVSQLTGMSGNLQSARPLYMQTKSMLASLEAQTDASAAAVLALYDEYSDEVDALSAHLDWVDWMMDALETASFKLTATESGVAAVEALFARPGLEPENGILFLTDQRLLWEDRVDDFEVKFEARLEQIQDIKKSTDETTGQELLQFAFGSGAAYPSAIFKLSLPVADDWLMMVGRARAGGYAQDTISLDPAELERIRNAPKLCPNCGAVFSTPIYRGQLEITCEYCGVVTRL